MKKSLLETIMFAQGIEAPTQEEQEKAKARLIQKADGIINPEDRGLFELIADKMVQMYDFGLDLSVALDCIKYGEDGEPAYKAVDRIRESGADAETVFMLMGFFNKDSFEVHQIRKIIKK